MKPWCATYTEGEKNRRITHLTSTFFGRLSKLYGRTGIIVILYFCKWFWKIRDLRIRDKKIREKKANSKISIFANVHAPLPTILAGRQKFHPPVLTEPLPPKFFKGCLVRLKGGLWAGFGFLTSFWSRRLSDVVFCWPRCISGCTRINKPKSARLR